MRLTTRIHDRDAAGMTYVYPVVSRRAGGVSVGINLNPNDACNWRCVYCQVPGLTFGKGPPIDLDLLERELRALLGALLHGDYMERHVPADARRLRDVAFSGNGEPTSSAQLAEAVQLAGRVVADLGLAGRIEMVLITNGSLVHQPAVQAGLRALAGANGVVWYKLDSATAAGQERMNTSHTGPERAWENLVTSARLCPTWLQTMVLARDGEPPEEAEREAYLALVERVVAEGVGVRGVHLYGLARPSHQPEAPELSALPREWMERFAEQIRRRGLAVRLSP